MDERMQFVARRLAGEAMADSAAVSKCGQGQQKHGVLLKLPQVSDSVQTAGEPLRFRETQLQTSITGFVGAVRKIQFFVKRLSLHKI